MLVPGAPNGAVSDANSTTALLGANATFTGAFEEVLDASMIGITAFSDVGSAVDGLHVEWSHDGVNVYCDEGTSVVAGMGASRCISVCGRYFRVRYTNGILAQGTFRLGTIYR
jgi:hypothetical protein